MTSDTELLQDALDMLRHEIRQASMALAAYTRDHGDDPVAYALADKIMSVVALERRYRRMLVNEEHLV